MLVIGVLVMQKNVNSGFSDKINRSMLIGAVIGTSIGMSALYSCILRADKVDSHAVLSNAKVQKNKEINNVNNLAYLSTGIVAVSVSSGLIALLRMA